MAATDQAPGALSSPIRVLIADSRSVMRTGYARYGVDQDALNTVRHGLDTPC